MKFLTTLLLVLCPLRIMCQFNMTAYREMPPLYIVEDYDACLDSSKPSSYCVVIGEIVPNTTSVLWNQIASFSAVHRRHYRHDYLYFGVCLNSCKQLIHPLSSVQEDKLYTGQIKNTQLTEFFDDTSKYESENRRLYDKIINICLNYNFEKQYGLQVRTYTQYCVSNDEPSNFDYSEIAFMIIVGMLLLLVVLSSNYDRQLKRQQPLYKKGNEFYQQHLDTQRDTLLTSFSVCRNYYRLTVPPSSEIGQDLQFLEGCRFVSTSAVMVGHIMFLSKQIPMQNPEFIEKLFYKFLIHMVYNGNVIIQLFLVMTSFLLCINFQLKIASKKPGIAEWGMMIWYRYLRLAPSLAFTILLSASILPRLQDGPFWKEFIQAEYVLCRETWWRNMLLINNFTWKKSCLLQTWYIATDFQLHIIFSGVLIVIARFPKTRNYILGAGVVISFLSTGMVTYFLDLNGVHQETPDSYRYFFWSNGDTIYKGYAPFYTNFGGFFSGIIAALLFLKYKKEDLNLKGRKSKLNKLLFVICAMLLLLLVSGAILNQFEYRKSSIWPGVIATLHRNLWALLCGSMTLLMSLKCGSILYKILKMNMFVPMGRLSFQVYLIHFVVIRCIDGYVHKPIYVNYLVFTMHIVTILVLSFILAFFLYILLELPLIILTDLAMKWIGKSGKVKKSNELIATTNKNSNSETTTT